MPHATINVTHQFAKRQIANAKGANRADGNDLLGFCTFKKHLRRCESLSSAISATNATDWLPERNLQLEPGLRMDGRDNHCAKPFP